MDWKKVSLTAVLWLTISVAVSASAFDNGVAAYERDDYEKGTVRVRC